MMKIVRTIVLLAFLLLIFPTLKVEALAPGGVGNLDIAVVPDFPGPNEPVRATLSTYSTDLNRAKITWTLGGSVIESGVGEKTVNFTSGKNGVRSVLSVRVEGGDGIILSGSVNITPAKVDLLWETSTYTPVLYKGKALHTSQATIKVVALPEIYVGSRRALPNDLVYEWTRNGDPLLSQSGYGKNSISIEGARIFGKDIVEVIVSTVNKEAKAKSSVTINTIDPYIVFYGEDELLGTTYNKTLGQGFNLGSEEFKLRAEPYFFSLEELTSSRLNYDWRLDGKKIEPESNKNILTLRYTGGGGSSQVSLKITNPLRSLQEALNTFMINFGNQNNES